MIKPKRDHDNSVSDVQVNLDTTRYMVSNYASRSLTIMIKIIEREQESDLRITDILKIL
jgi:hypothetical protein